MVQDSKRNICIFDFDGTLIDSAPAILEAYAAALRETGITPCVSLDSSLIGPPLMETLIRLSGGNDAGLIQSLSEKFMQHYDTIGVAKTYAYPGVEDMLDRLQGAAVPMHISTNKRLSVTYAILESLGWKGRFSSIYALDMVEPRLSGKSQLLTKQLGEQRLDPARAFYVGDKFEDGRAADANALAFNYASWGYGDIKREQLNSNWNWLSQPRDLCFTSLISNASGRAIS